jgi:hypothetical protein
MVACVNKIFILYFSPCEYGLIISIVQDSFNRQ